MSDPLSTWLAALPTAEPDQARAARTRVRCRTTLERRARRVSAARPPVPQGTASPIWAALMAALGAIYLADAIVVAVRVYGRG